MTGRDRIEDLEDKLKKIADIIDPPGAPSDSPATDDDSEPGCGVIERH